MENPIQLRLILNMIGFQWLEPSTKIVSDLSMMSPPRCLPHPPAPPPTGMQGRAQALGFEPKAQRDCVPAPWLHQPCCWTSLLVLSCLGCPLPEITFPYPSQPALGPVSHWGLCSFKVSLEASPCPRSLPWHTVSTSGLVSNPCWELLELPEFCNNCPSTDRSCSSPRTRTSIETSSVCPMLLPGKGSVYEQLNMWVSEMNEVFQGLDSRGEWTGTSLALPGGVRAILELGENLAGS